MFVCLGINKKQRPFRTSNFSTFLFTVLVDGAKPSTNFPREAGREAALKEATSAVNAVDSCGFIEFQTLALLTPQLLGGLSNPDHSYITVLCKGTNDN